MKAVKSVLIKVAKDCKKAHTKSSSRPKLVSPPRPTSTLPSRNTEHLFGKSFAEAVRKDADTDSDLDFDFSPDEANPDGPGIGFPNDPANAHLSVGGVLPSVVHDLILRNDTWVMARGESRKVVHDTADCNIATCTILAVVT